jgi:hypothetical protein
MKSIILLFVCALFIAPIAAQKKETNSSQVRLVKDQPHLYITFEREAKIEPLRQGESDRRIWLRFHNNSKWKVLFCDDFVPNLIPKEYGEILPRYVIERYSGSGIIPGAGRSDVCTYTTLKTGKSMLFNVPREHLAEGLRIKIKYRYQWEFDYPDGTTNVDEPEHYVSFYSGEIPKK